MDPGRPHAITILGRDLVLWRDQQGDWRAFEDLCPHRLAPLSGAASPLHGTAPGRQHANRIGTMERLPFQPAVTIYSLCLYGASCSIDQSINRLSIDLSLVSGNHHVAGCLKGQQGCWI